MESSPSLCIPHCLLSSSNSHRASVLQFSCVPAPGVTCPFPNVLFTTGAIHLGVIPDSSLFPPSTSAHQQTLCAWPSVYRSWIQLLFFFFFLPLPQQPLFLIHVPIGGSGRLLQLCPTCLTILVLRLKEQPHLENMFSWQKEKNTPWLFTEVHSSPGEWVGSGRSHLRT